MKKKDHKKGDLLLDLGRQPIANRFLFPDHKDRVSQYPVKIMLNNETGQIYLEEPFPVNELKPRYEWLTCFEPEDHLDYLVEKILKLPGIDSSSMFGGYSFKDDSTLERIFKKGFRNQWRIDPQSDLEVLDPRASVETYQSKFTIDKSEQIRKRNGYADVLVVRHVVEHAYDLHGFIMAISELVDPEGYIVWEIPDCANALDLGDCTTIWEEHTYYFTPFTFKHLLKDYGFEIVHYESIPYKLENSIVAITQKKATEITNQPRNKDALQKEIKRANQFSLKITDRKSAIQRKLKDFRENIGPIAIFGAGHLTVSFISMMEVKHSIDFVIDDDPNKNTMKMPIGNLMIYGSEFLYSKDIKLCLLGLNPQNQPKVVAKHKAFTDGGGKFASIFPGSNLYLEDMI